jgi:hypothetical protein
VDGKFAFDFVRAAAATDDSLWLATDGGVCQYDRVTFQPSRFFAGFAKLGPRQLARVREIVVDPAKPPGVFCRTVADGAESSFALAGDEWTETGEQKPFIDAYTVANERLMRFVRYPDGTLEAHLNPPNDRAVLGTRRGQTPLPLFSNNRFAFDDVQSAVLHQGRLYAATAAGVVEYDVSPEGNTADIVRLHCYPKNGTAPAMARLVRIVRSTKDHLLAWNAASVFQGKVTSQADGTANSRASVNWSVVRKLTGNQLTAQMPLRDVEATWILERRANANNTLRVYRLDGERLTPSPGDTGQSIASKYTSLDVSTAMMDEDWIYHNVKEGGLIRIRKSALQ